MSDSVSSNAPTRGLAYGRAIELLDRFRRGDTSPVELMEAVLQRAEQTESAVNALTDVFAERALREAHQAADRYASARRTGEPTPALLGIPVATKEKHGIAGQPLSEGVHHRRDQVALTDHPVIERIRAAGGIVHARTASPEFSCATITHSPMWGVTRNPWNLDMTPGGSSGGAGSALACGSTVLATGSDIGGSIRIPAGFTGTVGYKSPYGRVPGLPPMSLDTYRSDGAMARTVGDTLLLASVLSGVHALDHSTVPGSLPGLRGGCDTADLSGTTVGLCVRIGGFPISGSVRDNTAAFAQRLRDLGAQIRSVQLDWQPDVVLGLVFAHFGHLLAPQMRRLTTGHEHQLAPYTRRFISDATTAAQQRSLLDCTVLESSMQADLVTAMADVDVLVCPTSGVESLAADGDYPGEQVFEGTAVQHYWSANMTTPFNVCNRCPVLSVPTGTSSQGVPTSAQIVGHPYDETTVFAVALAAEADGFRMPDWPRVDRQNTER